MEKDVWTWQAEHGHVVRHLNQLSFAFADSGLILAVSSGRKKSLLMTHRTPPPVTIAGCEANLNFAPAKSCMMPATVVQPTTYKIHPGTPLYPLREWHFADVEHEQPTSGTSTRQVSVCHMPETAAVASRTGKNTWRDCLPWGQRLPTPFPPTLPLYSAITAPYSEKSTQQSKSHILNFTSPQFLNPGERPRPGRS